MLSYSFNFIPYRCYKALILTVFMAFCFATVKAQSISLKGVAGSKVLLSIGGNQPRFIGKGKSLKGVTLVQINGQSATFRSSEGEFKLRVGETLADPNNPSKTTPVVTASTNNQDTETNNEGAWKVRIPANKDGHYTPKGTINKKSVAFLLDTGASSIAMSISDANRLGINYKQGKKVVGRTASGNVDAYIIKLPKVSVEGLELENVEASVVDSNFSENSTMLLGMSFLSRVKMTFEKNQVLLEQKK